MNTITRSATGVLVGALLLAGCGSSDDAASTTTKAGATTTTVAASLELQDVWARQSPMGTSAGAVYLEITSPIDDSLVGASVPTSIAGTTEIHETVAAEDDEMSTTTAMGGDAMATTTTEAMADGDTTTTKAMADGDTTTTEAMGSESMTMRPVDAIELPAGKTVKLEPGGYHIMLLDLVKPLEVGQTFDLTLSFQVAGDRTVTAEVREG